MNQVKNFGERCGREIVLGCVAENTPQYLSQALRLLQSVRWFGGSFKDAAFYVCAVDGIDPCHADQFQRYNGLIRIVDSFNPRHKQSNKLRFLQLQELDADAGVLLLDCDTVVTQDPGGKLAGDVFQAKIADLPTVPLRTFQNLFAFFNLPLPPQTYLCTASSEPTVPYFNAGVLFFPARVRNSLVPLWIEYNEKLLDNLHLLEDACYFCEQASLSLALAAGGLEFLTLGNEMNFPVHLQTPEALLRLASIDPVILHYHWLVDSSGYLQGSPLPLVQKRIELFNSRLRKERELDFKQRIFCDFHYYTEPDLRSGLDPRGTVRAYKKELLHAAGARNATNMGAHQNVTVACQDRSTPEQPALPGPAEKPTPTLERPIFIVGAMRSGTTLLAELLGSHPDIVHCPFELKDVWSRVGGAPMASAKTGDRHCPELRAEDADRQQSRALTLAFQERMNRNREGKSESALFLNKNPHLCNKLPFVQALFPGARFLFIRRGLVEVVASLKRLFADVYRRQQTRHYWPEPTVPKTVRCWMAFHGEEKIPAELNIERLFPGGNPRWLAEYWLESNRAVCDFLRQNPGHGLMIEEEELISDPEVQLARCLEFLHLPPRGPEQPTADLDAGRNDQWRSLLSERELKELGHFFEERMKDVDRVSGLPGKQALNALLAGPPPSQCSR